MTAVGKGNLGKRGAEAPNWKGGQHLDRDGRWLVWDPEQRRYFHRSVIVWKAAHPGEDVGPGYVVHHLDGDKENDVPENLEKLSLAAHVARHRRALLSYIESLQRLLEEHGVSYPPLWAD